MTPGISVMLCALALTTVRPQAAGENSPGPSGHVGTSVTPDLRETDPRHEVPRRKHNLAGRAEASAAAAAVTPTEGAAGTQTYAGHVKGPVSMAPRTAAVSPSAAAHSLSSTPAAQTTTASEGRPLLTREPLLAFSSRPTPPVRDARPTAPPSTTRPQPAPVTTATAQASAPGRGPAGPTHREVPSELNVGDEDFKGPRYRSSSPLDPLLAALLSVFIVTTAIVFVALFLKFRQRTNHPEFHRLQDVPMDDLMEDTPLARHTY